MQATGLNIPGLASPARRDVSIGGIMTVKSLSAVQEDEARAAHDAAVATNNSVLVQSLASQIRRHWTLAKEHKENDAQKRIIAALRSKRGEYDPLKESDLKSQGSSLIYMMLFATKARQAKSLIGDVLLGSGDEKPWSVKPTAEPTLPEELVSELLRGAAELVAQAEMSGVPMGIGDIRQLLRDAKEQAQSQIELEARTRMKRAERKIEDLLQEGGFIEALNAFLDDLMVSPKAFLKGPVIRRCGVLQWAPGPDGTSVPVATFENKPQWERVDPLNIYPAPWSRSVNDGFLIEHHRLAPTAIAEMIGVPGYKEPAIRAVLDAYSSGGLREWLRVDQERAHVETPGTSDPTLGSDMIDALQYWGSVTGKVLREWGMPADEVPDTAAVYEIEAWLVGDWVIKAEINTDPLARRPYYGDSYEAVPGAFWGNSLYDLVRDAEDMCNAAARALSNNMGISSGPQVWVMADRMPAGEEITTLYPWKIHQVTSDPSGSTAAPIGFFQPTSNAAELMGVYERFSVIADEVSGIPRYMTGDGSAGGAGRTASGMSMMVGNAGKTTKNTVRSLDFNVIGPSVRSAFEFTMRYVGDPDIKGDLQVVARGAMSLMVKDTAQVRRAEFLRDTANPIDMQIMGLDGRAAVLREGAKSLDMNTDDVVPPLSVIRQRLAMQSMAQAEAAQQTQGQQPSTKPGEKRLMNDAPATDNFSS
jgi:hypothetical protein